ncbi:MAG: molecular chaperone HtpG [Clostridia bacterium]|nr:molecular chaperone HtpG [Clostridia bacterium]
MYNILKKYTGDVIKMATGKIQVNTENIFPVIKKWLYSDKDIFIRELISNGCDAVSKLKKLEGMGKANLDEKESFAVTLSVDKEKKQLVFSDNGIGMTAEEVEKYIAQVAFSGAQEFLEKYKDEDGSGNIIGHFGLGFYSAFMVSESVEIETLSYQEDAEAVHWTCDGGTEYSIEKGTKKTRGTDIILNINEESAEFLEYSKVMEIVNKYCYFLPTNIYVIDANKKSEEGKDETPLSPVNDTAPLWLKNPSQCTQQEYKDFYHKVFYDFNEPLFWIHLNIDFPFNLKGILYFPKIDHELKGAEGQVKLYNNQVFVADNLKEVIPEYLLLLKGCIDCPDIPLNVSRSFLQNDGFVKKVSAHITKKVADKLNGLFGNDRTLFEGYWDDINPFIKYGCMRDESFYDKVKDSIIYKTTEGKYVTINEYLEGKEEKLLYYTSNPETQTSFIEMFKSQDISVLELPYAIDTHFISYIEYKNTGIKFERIDSAVDNIMSVKDDAPDSSKDEIIKIFKEIINDESLKIDASLLKTSDVPAVLTLSEQSRRMQEMASMFNGGMDMPQFKKEYTLTVNTASPVIKKLLTATENRELVVNYVYDLASIAQGAMTAERMNDFLKRAGEIAEKI